LSDVVLQVEGLTGPAEAPVVHDIELHVERGCTNVVLGQIHSGKTMVMRHLVGLERAEQGTLEVEGVRYDPRGEADDRLREMRTRLGVVFEGSALMTRLGVVENVELPILEHTGASPREARDAARELLADVGLRVDDDTMPQQLGRAGQRRVAVARALALRPALLLLDEPTFGLDSHSAAELDDTLARIQEREGFGTLVFSHEVRHAYGRAKEIFVMARGRIVARGSRAELLDDPHEAVRRLLNRRTRR